MNFVNDSIGTSKIEAGVNLTMTAARHVFVLHLLHSNILTLSTNLVKQVQPNFKYGSM